MMIDDTRSTTTQRSRTVRHLHDLIAALDRRVPQVQRVGEVSIAEAAAVLRAEALKRIEEIEREAIADSRRAMGSSGALVARGSRSPDPRS